VSRLGHVGLHIERCPFCGCEHVHGGYRPYDIRQAIKAMDGWRSPGCDQAPDEYQLKQAAGPARYAPWGEIFRACTRDDELFGFDWDRNIERNDQLSPADFALEMALASFQTSAK
jgi:hypothetical protein